MAASSLLSQYQAIERHLISTLAHPAIPIETYLNIVTTLIDLNKLIRSIYIETKYRSGS
jgi:hypothetical protein